MKQREQIQKLAEELFSEVVFIRREIHKNPELSFVEFNTSALVKRKLTEIGIPFSEIGGTGIVALIQGNNPESKCMALRADLDALPILEKTEKEYSSSINGVMHACGHDFHTASLIGAATILNKLKADFNGTIKLIFQPGEEKLPGGASILIKEGVLENPKPECILGQHVYTELEAGKAGFRKGIYMASTDEIYLTVKGKGGHGAMPHQVVDPILISAHLIVALQQIVSRIAKPQTPSVLSFGKIVGEGATNVIPDEVKLEGTFRTFDETWRAEAHKKITELAIGLVESMGGKAEVEIRKGYPFLKNDVKLTGNMSLWASEFLGETSVEELDIRTTAEDFAYYTHEIPGCFYRIGTGNKAKGINASVHSPYFDVDENALKTSMGLMAFLAFKYME